MYLKTRQKATVFEQLKLRFVAKKAFRMYSLKSCRLNPAGVARSISLRLFPVLVPFCNSLRTSISSGLPARLSYQLIFVDFRQADDLLLSGIELVLVPLGGAGLFLQRMHITRCMPIALPKW